MADDGLQDRQIHAATNGSGDECVAAGVGGQPLSADLLHQLLPLPLCVVCADAATFVAVDQERGTGGNRRRPDLLVSLQAIGAYRDHSIFAGCCFAAIDEIIIKTIRQRDLTLKRKMISCGSWDWRGKKAALSLGGLPSV